MALDTWYPLLMLVYQLAMLVLLAILIRRSR